MVSSEKNISYNIKDYIKTLNTVACDILHLLNMIPSSQQSLLLSVNFNKLNWTQYYKGWILCCPDFCDTLNKYLLPNPIKFITIIKHCFKTNTLKILISLYIISPSQMGLTPKHKFYTTVQHLWQRYLLLGFFFKGQNDKALSERRNPAGVRVDGKHGSWKSRNDGSKVTTDI